LQRVALQPPGEVVVSIPDELLEGITQSVWKRGCREESYEASLLEQCRARVGSYEKWLGEQG
jgi:hypothetical protein